MFLECINGFVTKSGELVLESLSVGTHKITRAEQFQIHCILDFLGRSGYFGEQTVLLKLWLEGLISVYASNSVFVIKIQIADIC